MFKVEKIIDGNTIVVNPKWIFCNESGNMVVVRGYNPVFANDVSEKWHEKLSRLYKKFFTERNEQADQEEQIENVKNNEYKNMFANLLAKGRLEFLINEKFVDLRNGSNETANCIDKEGRMNCHVYINDINISEFFVEFDK